MVSSEIAGGPVPLRDVIAGPIQVPGIGDPVEPDLRCRARELCGGENTMVDIRTDVFTQRGFVFPMLENNMVQPEPTSV